MGEEDIRRQRPNVFSMKLLGAEVRPVTQRLADAPRRHQRGLPRLDELGRDHALLPRLGRRAASVPADRPRFPVGHRPRDARRSACEQLGRLPDVVVACVGGGSNAAGMFYPFVDDAGVELVGVEAGGRSDRARRPCRHALLRPARRAARQLQLRAPGRRRPDLPTSTASRPAWTIRASAPSTAIGKRPAGCSTPAPATTRPWPPSTRWPAAKASCRPWKVRTPWPRRWSWPPRRKPDEVIVVCLSGRGDKDARGDRAAAGTRRCE